jgi:hypothetical protein
VSALPAAAEAHGPLPPWTFGLAPLAQTTELAAKLRRVTSLAVGLEHTDPGVAALIEALDEAERTLSRRASLDAPPRIGAAADSDGRPYLDHCRHIGAYNPGFPEYAITVDGDEAHGTVTFPIAYEGPPGLVHGGFLAVFFDAVIQHHNCDLGTAGKTTSLALRYRRPTPLLTELSYTLHRCLAGERIHSTGELRRGDAVVCEAQMESVKGDRSKLPAVSPRRPAVAPGRPA